MVSVGDKVLELKDVYKVLFDKEEIHLSEKALKKVNDSYTFLDKFQEGKLIYGINTGFGPMAQYKIADGDHHQLQYNLIRSHSAGTGKILGLLDTKALMIARLSSFMQGYSGVHQDLVLILQELINKEIYPCIYEHGGVGASGDLVQLAHLGLALIGEGEVYYKGEIQNAKEVFAKENIKPLSIHKREGLAILNGTSVMTGVGAVNIIYAKKLLNWSVALSTMINELVEAYDDHFSAELNAVKHHYGQQKIAAAMRSITSEGKLVRKRKEHLYNKENIQVDVVHDKVQEYYSLRCVPQILGPIFDTVEYAEKVVVNEINSVNDNPIIDQNNHNVFHGGNFHGDYISLEMDKLKLAITKLAMLSERQLNYLVNARINQKFPPFLNRGKLGFNFGIQGMQFTAVSTTAECQTLSTSSYIHSIPNNNDNQDVVSMGTNAAVITRKIIDNAFEVLGVQAIAIAEAIDCAELKESLSPVSRRIYDQVRALSPLIQEDKPLYKQLRLVIEHLKKENLNILNH